MHILYLVKTSEGATWALRLLEGLKNKYNNITFSAILPPGGKHFDDYKKMCENVYEFEFELGKNILRNGKILKEIVAKDKPDIIHSWFTQTTLYARFFLRNIQVPRIFQVVGPLHLESSIFKFFDIKSAQKNDYWVATSKYILNKYLKAGVKKSKLFLNYAFIDTDKTLRQKNRNKNNLDQFRKKYKISNNLKILGTASYIYPPKFYQKNGVKGHEQLLDVFEKILMLREDVVLIIAGTTFGGNNTYENKLKKKAAKISKDKIIFTGRYTNVHDIISNFDAFIYLSKSENLGGVYESLLFEIPTISSDRGGLTELVINNETGYNVSLEENNKIVETIIKLLSQDNASFKAKGRKKVEDVFNKEQIICKAYNIYIEILGLNNLKNN
jgi:glycosyltransferase involved in cell wall biosynthesis